MKDDIGKLSYDLLQRKSDFTNTFSSEQGQRVLAYLMKISGIPKKQVTADASHLLIQEGQQHIVYTILKILNVDQQEILEKIQDSYVNE